MVFGLELFTVFEQNFASGFVLTCSILKLIFTLEIWDFF